VSPVIKEIFELLNSRLQQIMDDAESRLQQLRDDAETCSSDVAGTELQARILQARIEEIGIVIECLRSHVVNKFSERMAKARARVQVLLH
jgi:hypothetical protein